VPGLVAKLLAAECVCGVTCVEGLVLDDVDPPPSKDGLPFDVVLVLPVNTACAGKGLGCWDNPGRGPDQPEAGLGIAAIKTNRAALI